ncbi:hypothetical protein [Nocardioides sp.]|uniref:hypothetical protein n=1 Tax=Nocardioides sp. TaxID=35761 RepID=UPI0035B4ADDD
MSTGWPAVESKAADLGVRFRWWQKPIGKIILAKRADGKYASTIGGTGLSIPRQVGKTFLVGAIVFALCLLRPKLTVIWTAHRVRTAEETFGKMQAFAGRRRVAPYVEKIVLGSGEEEIAFRNGSRILFGARAKGFGRGFDEVDVLIFDEAQILTDAALDDMIPATNQSRQPESALLLFMGTPPKPADPSEVWMRMREEALSGEDDDTGWVEFGADEDHEFTPLPAPLSEADWKQIAKANPSFPEDTPREAILRMRKKLGSASFCREGAGQYDNADHKLIFPKWPSCQTDEMPDEVTAIGLAVSLGEEFGSICSARVWEDGRVNLGAVERRVYSRSYMVSEAKRIQEERECAVALDEKCPDAGLLPALIEAGVAVQVMTLAHFVETTSDLVQRTKDKRVTHQSTDDLDAAVVAAKWRSVGDGRRVPGRKASSGDIDMLEAGIAALWAAGLDLDPWEAWT